MRICYFIIQAIKSIDQFGALFQFHSTHRSFHGAIATIILYGLSMAYLIYLITIWVTDQISPNIVTQNILNSQGHTFKLNQSPFYYTIESYDDQKLETYKGQKLYNIQAQFFPGDQIIYKENYSPNCSNSMSVYVKDFFEPFCLNVTDPDSNKITQNLTNRTYDDSYDFYLYPCNTEDDSCIDQYEAEEFLADMDQQEGRLTLITQEWDINTNSLQTIPQDFYFDLSYDQSLSISLSLAITKLKIIRGIFFPTVQTYEFVGRIDFQLQNTFRSIDQPYASLSATLGRKEIHLIIEYPTLPKILAQFSAIFSLVITLGIFINLLNTTQMKKNLINQIGDIYFSNFSNYQQAVQKKKQVDLLEQEKFDELKEILQSKCNFLSILYEISKIQIALSSLITMEQLKKIQCIQYELNLNRDSVSNREKNQISSDYFRIFDRSFVSTNQNSSELMFNLNKQDGNKGDLGASLKCFMRNLSDRQIDKQEKSRKKNSSIFPSNEVG